MHLDSKKLKEVIIEVLQEANGRPARSTTTTTPVVDTPATPATLAGGAGVQQTTLKRGMRKKGEELADIEDFTPQEGKIIERYMNLLQLASSEMDVSKGPIFNYLNTAYKKLAQIVQQETAKKETKI